MAQNAEIFLQHIAQTSTTPIQLEISKRQRYLSNNCIQRGEPTLTLFQALMLQISGIHIKSYRGRTKASCSLHEPDRVW